MPDHAVVAAQWIDANPRAMDIFERMAMRRVDARKRFGMKQLAEVVRWEMTIDMQPGEDFKVNNNYVSYLARWLIAKHPELSDLIETRHAGSAAA